MYLLTLAMNKSPALSSLWLHWVNPSSQPNSDVSRGPPMVWPLPSSSDLSPTMLSLVASVLATQLCIPPIHSAAFATGPRGIPAWGAQFPLCAVNPKSPFRSQLKCHFLKEGLPGLPA